jgi:nucleotide-binding universal stress UspA family protein/MFS family permease
VGIALGPLIGGELGAVSWRGPFYGVTVLMAISLVATIAFVQGTPRSAHPTSILEPIRALRHRGLATMSVTALFYNWGFFTLLAYTPFLMHLGIHELGYVFTCWGILVAIFAVFAAPRLQRRFGTPATLYVSFALLAADLLVIALFPSSKTTLIVAVIVSGAFIGLNNTLTTQAVMSVAPVEKPIASASYGFVRFIGGGLAPYVASKLAITFNVSLPFYVAAGSVVIAIFVLATGHALLVAAEKGPAEESVGPSSAYAPTSLPRVTTPAAGPVIFDERIAAIPRSPIVAAVDAGPYAERVTDVAIEFARLLECSIEVLHVIETDVIEELALDLESHDVAVDVASRNVSRVRAAGLAGGGHLLRVISDHGEVGRRIAEFANDRGAQMVVIGTPSDTDAARAFNADLTNSLIREAHCALHIVPTGADRRRLSAIQSASR